MVLQANNSGVINRDILRFNIFDNDGENENHMDFLEFICFAISFPAAVSIGFEYIVFAFGEDAGVLTDEFRVIIQNGVISEQNLTVTVTIFVFNGSSNGATPGQLVVCTQHNTHTCSLCRKLIILQHMLHYRL